VKRHHSQERHPTSVRSVPDASPTGRWAAQLSASPRMQAQRRKIEQSFGSAAQCVSGAAPARSNATGMPDSLKVGMESLSGLDLSDVRVHRDSDRPAQLNALAFAQGKDIYLGPQQEQHLPHEAWHIVQQAQGRVRPTTQMMNATINDDPALEYEADQMGDRASSLAASVPEEVAAQRFATVPVGSTVREDFETLQRKKELAPLLPFNQLAWDLLWLQVGTYFDDSAKGWFDVAAKTMLRVPKAEEFGHSSDKKGGGSRRAESRFATLQEEVWHIARMGGEMPSKGALKQLRAASREVPAGIPLTTAQLESEGLRPAVPGVAQLVRYTRVIGGMQVDLDETTSTTTTEELRLLYKNYFLPSRHQENYRQFGIDVRAELIRRGVEVPQPEPEIEWIFTSKGVEKYGLINGRFYVPTSAHKPAGVTHYPGYKGTPNTRSVHVKMTQAGVELMNQTLQVINAGKATFVKTDESFTNVYVEVGGVQWGLHLGEDRQIFPMAGQNLGEYFDA
jgi:hypothetical protein